MKSERFISFKLKTKNFWKNFVHHKLACVGLVVIVLELLIVIFGPMLFELDPYSIGGSFNGPPDAEHIIGTDSLGRDMLARLVYGGRVSMLVGFGATAVSMILGVVLGLFAGFYRGWVETIIMRLADIIMSFPGMILFLVVFAIWGSSVWNVVVVLALFGWTSIAKLICSGVLSVREKEYVEAAKAVGLSNIKIIFKEILPNVMAPVWVAMAFMVCNNIISESSLSFLGVGIQPPAASWGNILQDSKQLVVLQTRPWQWIPPVILLIITTFSINFVGEGLRDALDPKMKR